VRREELSHLLGFVDLAVGGVDGDELHRLGVVRHEHSFVVGTIVVWVLFVNLTDEESARVGDAGTTRRLTPSPGRRPR
jgi:hypothetical protein